MTEKPLLTTKTMTIVIAIIAIHPWIERLKRRFPIIARKPARRTDPPQDQTNRHITSMVAICFLMPALASLGTMPTTKTEKMLPDAWETIFDDRTPPPSHFVQDDSRRIVGIRERLRQNLRHHYRSTGYEIIVIMGNRVIGTSDDAILTMARDAYESTGPVSDRWVILYVDRNDVPFMIPSETVLTRLGTDPADTIRTWFRTKPENAVIRSVDMLMQYLR